jgi:hypothetical protein
MVIRTPHEIREVEMGEECGMYRGKVIYIQVLGGET